MQMTNGYRQTDKAFQTLYSRLRTGGVHSEIRSCLLMIIHAIEQRNYQRANEIYLQLSIGNQQWPIGVTSVGIHERKAREKLSFYANEKSQAHIMNDEATRKYLHGVSRLIKAVQGLRPTDPSRSVNFNAVEVRPPLLVTR
jgi:pre-mRNA-splicing factor 18